MRALSVHAGAGRLSAEVDARDLATAAAELGFERQRVLVGAAATRAAFERELVTAAALIDAGDALLVTFSGHGLRDAWQMIDGAFAHERVGRTLAMLPHGAHAWVLVDACHGAAVVECLQCVRADVTVIAACGADELASAGGMNRRSPFVAALLRLLQQDRPPLHDLARAIDEIVQRIDPSTQQRAEVHGRLPVDGSRLPLAVNPGNR